MTLTLGLFTLVIVLAFIFGLTNGFIDGGGLVSTVITTRALEPFWALLLVAVGEVAGILLLGQAVAHMLAQHMVVFPLAASPVQALGVLAAALAGALVWNTGMWRLALPSSSSHALVGGLAGAMLSVFGSKALYWPVFMKIFIFLGIVPIAGAFLGLLLARITYWLGQFLTPGAGKVFRGLQIVSLGGMAMVHGSNDGQKCLAMLLLAVLALKDGGGVLPVAPWASPLVRGGTVCLGCV